MSDGVSIHDYVCKIKLILETQGGSAYAAGEMIKKMGGDLLSFVFILELEFLKGRDKLPAPVYTLLSGQA